MKKFILLLFIFPVFSFAQTLQFYKASEGLATATAAAESRLENPVLTSIAVTIGLSFEVPVVGEVSITFDEETGESNIFAYVFCDENNRSQTALIPVVNVPFLGFQDATEFIGEEIEVSPEDMRDLVGEFNLSETWIDSDEFILGMKNSQEHQDFVSQYSNSELALVVLANDEEPTSEFYGNTFWVVRYTDIETDETAFICGMDALSKDIYCQEDFPGSVINLTTENSEIAPNPAISYTTIKLDNIKNINDVILVDIYGNEINTNFSLQSSNEIFLNTSNLNLGTYFVKIVSNDRTYLTKFIKSE